MKALIESGERSPHACNATSKGGSLLSFSMAGGHSSRTERTPGSSREDTR